MLLIYSLAYCSDLLLYVLFPCLLVSGEKVLKEKGVLGSKAWGLLTCKSETSMGTSVIFYPRGGYSSISNLLISDSMLFAFFVLLVLFPEALSYLSFSSCAPLISNLDYPPSSAFMASL